MTLYIKMDDWNRLCDYFNLPHGSDIDMFFRTIEGNGVKTSLEYEDEIENLEGKNEDLNDDIQDLRKDISDLENDNDALKEKLKEMQNRLLDTIEEINNG